MIMSLAMFPKKSETSRNGARPLSSHTHAYDRGQRFQDSSAETVSAANTRRSGRPAIIHGSLPSKESSSSSATRTTRDMIGEPQDFDFSRGSSQLASSSAPAATKETLGSSNFTTHNKSAPTAKSQPKLVHRKCDDEWQPVSEEKQRIVPGDHYRSAIICGAADAPGNDSY